MAYNILAINPGHNGSVALVSDGKLVYFCEEDRVSRVKYDGNPFKSMLGVLANTEINELIICGTTNELPSLPWTMENPYTALVRKFYPNAKTTLMGHLHHLGHAASAFYGSGFDTAAVIVVDGSGSYTTEVINDQGHTVGGFETESIYRCSYPHEFDAIYKRYSDGSSQYYDNGIQEFDNTVTITKAYEAVTNYLGFGFIDAGKTMGLAPYGEIDENIPDFFVNGKGNKNLLTPMYPAGALIDENHNLYLKRYDDPNIWHNNPSNIREIDKNIAYKIQLQTEEMMYELIQKAIDNTGESNIVITGGYALNCVANYKYLKKFPGISFYIDPIAHDGGSTIGMAKFAWYNYSRSTEIDRLTSVYLGNSSDYSVLGNILDMNKSFSIQDTTASDIADLIIDGNIVALFQGRSEAGPRALGNRSILFDPRNQNGKELVNIVKKREWFRPFAGSVLCEYASDYFDMQDLSESPFMMYAVDVLPSAFDIIPAVIHVDGTCRVQTVSREDNNGYYELISEFHKKTGVPVLFNTSFNLAGQPLVDNIFDAIVTMANSEINYMYLPDIGKIVIKDA